ncbi:MAG: GTP pyrophosphokinase family protein [Lachnospiraceae bacterium]
MEKEKKAERKIISDFQMSLSDNEYQLKCRWAIQTIESKLSMIDLELREKKDRVVVSQVTHRIKSAESIYRKLQRKGYKINLKEAKKKLNDIIGIRVTCLFQDDVYEIVNCLSLQADIHILKVKDYIKEPKETGYQSLHLIVEVPIYLTKKAEWVKVEIQLRTVAMDFWSVLDYQLIYKKEVAQADEIAEELKHYAEIIADVDKNMMKLRDRILAI